MIRSRPCFGISLMLLLAPLPLCAGPLVYVCEDGDSAVFSDRPCSEVSAIRPQRPSSQGRSPSTVPAPASARPQAPPQGWRPALEQPDDALCERLLAQLELLDDRMRAGYTAREASQLWNRWRELKAQIRARRC